MLTRKSGILALVFGAAVLGACEQKAPIVNIPPTPTVTTVTISGAPSLPIKKGATVQLIAVVSGNDNQAVTWSVLSGSNVASVSSTGLVTALQPGTATIQAQSQAVASAKAAVSIQVADTTTGGGGVIGQPSITIGSITQGGTTFPVNLGNVAGTVDVTMNVDIPTGVKATALQLSVKNLATGATTVVPCQTFSATGSSDASVEGAQAPQTVICSVPTNQVGANGVPTFANGQYTITAQLLNGNTVIASAVTQTMVFNNVSSLILGVTSAKTAPDASGLVWMGGDLTVTVTPSIFTSGTTFQTFTVQVISVDTTGATVTVQKTVSTTGVAAATVVFKADSSSSAGLGLKGLEWAGTMVKVTGVTGAGTLFDNGGVPFQTTGFKYDDAAPRLTGVVPTYNLVQQPTSLQWWLKSSATFPGTCTLAAAGPPPTYNCGSSSTAATANGVAEAGVDVVTWQFQTAVASASTLVWTTQTSVAGIGAQPAATLIARVNVCDNLGNCKNTATANNSPAFGVDLLAPVIFTVSDVSGVQTNPVTITVAAQDTGANASGFPLRYVSVQIQKDSASSTSTGGVDVTKCVVWRANTATDARFSTAMLLISIDMTIILAALVNPSKAC